MLRISRTLLSLLSHYLLIEIYQNDIMQDNNNSFAFIQSKEKDEII